MAIKKSEEPKTRKVRVNEQRSYVDEEPIVEIIDEELEETIEPTPIQTFLQSIDNSRSLTMKVFLLPNFYKDGKRSIRANERPFVTQFPFSNEDIQDYQQRIQQACPAGGMFQMELREGWQMVRMWEEAIAPAPGYQANTATHPQQTYPIIVNPAMNPAPPALPQMNPAEVMREHMTLAKDLVQMARDLQPPTPTINMGAGDDKPSMEDRLFETVLVKALESNKTPIDKVLDAMSGRRSEPSWMETLMPVISEVIKAFAPAINTFAQRAAQQAQAAQTGLQQAQLGAAPQEPVAGQEPVASVPIDPVQRDWFQAMLRLLEDCTRHVELASVGGGGKSVLPNAEAILELAERYPEQLGPTITILLGVSPIEVLDSCAMMLDERGQAHVNGVLKPAASALKWIEDLQGECKRIMSEAQEGEGDDEDKAGD